MNSEPWRHQVRSLLTSMALKTTTRITYGNAGRYRRHVPGGASQAVRPELLRAPQLVNDRPSSLAIREAPEVDVLAIIADYMTVAIPIGSSKSTVVELEAVSSPSRAIYDFDFLTIKPFEHLNPFSLCLS